jgi:hypothetical protein
MTKSEDDCRQEQVGRDPPIYTAVRAIVKLIEKAFNFALSAIFTVAALYLVGWLLWNYQEARAIALLIAALATLCWISSKIIKHQLKTNSTLIKLHNRTIIPLKKSISDGATEIAEYSKILFSVAIGLILLIAVPLIALLLFGALFSAVGLGMGIVIVLLILILLK